MRNSKRTISLVMIAMFTMLIVLSGSPATGLSKSALKKAVKATDEFVKLNFVILKPNADMSHQESVEAALNKELETKLPNTEIHFTFIDGGDAYNNKLNLMWAAGEEFDLCMATTGWNPIVNAVSKKNIIPLDDLLTKYGPDILKKIEPKYWPAVTYGGKRYSIPHPFVYSQPFGFAFKADLVDKYKFDIKKVKTVRDMEPFLAKIKANERGMTPLFPETARIERIDNRDEIMRPFFYYLSDNKVKSTYDDKENIASWKALSSYYKKGYISKDRIAKTDYIAEARTGKYAVTTDAGAYDPKSEKSTKAYGFKTYEVLFSNKVIGTTAVTATGTGISATSKHPERAMMFMNLLYKDVEFSNHVAYGVEGEDWTYVSGKGTDKPVIKTSDNMKWAIWKCWIDPLWDQWGSNWNSYESLAFMKKGTDSAKISPILGFTFNSEPVKSQIAQMTPIIVEADKILTCGVTSNVDKYLVDVRAKLKAAGSEKVLAEINKQLAAWRTVNKKK